MLAQMIDKIVSLKETKAFEIGGQTYTDGHLTRIPPHVDRPEAISVSGLDGVCKLIRTELEKVVTTRGEVVSCEIVPGANATDAGYRPHWATCPQADRFKRGGRHHE